MIVRGESTITDYNAPFDQGLRLDTCSEFRWISLIAIINFRKPTQAKSQTVSNSVIILYVFELVPPPPQKKKCTPLLN